MRRVLPSGTCKSLEEVKKLIYDVKKSRRKRSVSYSALRKYTGGVVEDSLDVDRKRQQGEPKFVPVQASEPGLTSFCFTLELADCGFNAASYGSLGFGDSIYV